MRVSPKEPVSGGLNADPFSPWPAAIGLAGAVALPWALRRSKQECGERLVAQLSVGSQDPQCPLLSTVARVLRRVKISRADSDEELLSEVSLQEGIQNGKSIAVLQDSRIRLPLQFVTASG